MYKASQIRQKLKFDRDVSLLSKAIVFYSNGLMKVYPDEVSYDDVEKAFVVNLTQDETLNLYRVNTSVQVQLLFNGGGTDFTEAVDFEVKEPIAFEKDGITGYADIETVELSLTNEVVAMAGGSVFSVNGKIGNVLLTAKDIDFEDGQSFQEKYESGELKGEKGDNGINGSNGNDGVNGTDGLLYEAQQFIKQATVDPALVTLGQWTLVETEA